MLCAIEKIATRRFVHIMWQCVPFLIALASAALLFSPRTASAVEPAEEFVKGLQERGMDDLAIEYLDRLKTSPLATEAIKKRIPYLRGVALVEQAKQSTDPAERNKLLDAGRRELEQFAETNPNSVSGAEAQLQLATVQMTRGQELVAQTAQLPKEKAYDSQRRDLGREARLRFAEAHETYERAETAFNAELEKLPPTTNADAREDGNSKRQDMRGRVAQLKFLAAQTRFEAAESYPPEADEFKKLHEAAADELSAVYDEFGRTMLVGLYARLFEGRCYQAVGNYALALGCYDELIGKDNILGPFRKLAAASMQRKAEVLIAQNKLDAAIEGCSACLKDAHKDEEKLPEWVGVRYRLADALSKKAAAATAESAEQRKLLTEARDAYRLVSKSPGEFQVAARAAASAGRSSGGETAAKESSTTKKSEGEEPRTFQAAYDAGKEALSSYNAAKLAIPSAEKNNPPAVPELQAQMERGKGDARHYFQVATSLVGTDTDPKLVNEVRYFLCWLYWDAEDYYRSAVLGEFLAKRYPDASTAASAAKIAMASYERLYNLAATTGNKKNNGDFEAQRMAQMAEFITRRWPGTENADSAFGVLVTFAIHANKPEEAEKLLQQVSAPSRPRLELMLGNALWTRYLELSQASQSNQPDTDELAKIKTTATKYLKSGFDAAKKESPLSEAGATAALYLVQAELSDGDFGDAILLLEDSSGPLALIEKQDPTATKPAYEIETYKAALRAYVSVSPPQEKKAMKTMQSLEKVVQANVNKEKASEQLTRIYVGMGTALQKQMEELRTAGRQGEATRVAAAFGKFLDKIRAGEASANWPTRVWLAQTYFTMGNEQFGSRPASSAASSGEVLGKVSRDYLMKARDAYLQLLAEASKDPKLAPSETGLLGIRMQLGECYRALGEYDKSLDLYYDILKEKETSLAVQRAAALAYQDRGQREDVKWFENAIHGGYPIKQTNQNRIWGWLRLAQVAGQAAKRDPKFNDTFFEARLNVSRCRYLAAMKQPGDARRQELGKAKQTLQSVAQLYPDLGGEKWKSEFEALLKQIQSAENETASDKNAESSATAGKS
jgi:hypothetical protein